MLASMTFDSSAPADTFGDYAVDHGHVDDLYAPTSGQLEADEIRRECLAAERGRTRPDTVLVTRPY
jgi:hypothetical protein